MSSRLRKIKMKIRSVTIATAQMKRNNEVKVELKWKFETETVSEEQQLRSKILPRFCNRIETFVEISIHNKILLIFFLTAYGNV